MNWLYRKMYALYCRLSPRKRLERELALQIVMTITSLDPKVIEVRKLFLKILSDK